ncbi:hypothetical protein SASPL_145166 [Salvia splendens]|uniref:Myb/SANT-like domain-containing protein n=1 Tax=Salvia splendens TaxID=180675 RepID=A0A8X8Z7W7_SALSN|nr:hypothetical protein SASPL_145166 [Salvia splendens]
MASNWENKSDQDDDVGIGVFGLSYTISLEKGDPYLAVPFSDFCLSKVGVCNLYCPLLKFVKLAPPASKPFQFQCLWSDFCRDGKLSGTVINDHLGRNRKRKGDRKGDRTRRSWTDREEVTLVIALKDIVARGWKSDNGFRGGYLTKLEDAMRSRSGVGFNNKGDYKIDCNDDQWDQIVKERASGTVAADYMDSVNNLHSLEQMQESFGTIGEQVIPDEQPSMNDQPSMDPLGGTPTPAGAANSTSHGGRANATSGSVGNKKKLSELGTYGLVHLLEKLHEDTNKRLDTLSLRIGYEFDLSKARKDVFQLLGKLPGLTREQKFDVGEILLEKVERLDFFLGMQDEDRSAYVLRALAKFM